MPRERQSSSTPSKPMSPKVKVTASPESPGIRQLQREWNASLPEPWRPDPDFVHPEGTWTGLKGSMKKYKLTSRDLASLPYEQRLSRSGYKMHLYSRAQLLDLSRRKRAKLMLDPLPAPASALRMPDWMEHMRHPNPPPLKIETYTCPLGAAKADPEEITWTPRKLSGSVAVEDACRLYCITPEDIEDLSKVSKWIDLGTVARRAVTLHGGFYAHEAIVRRARYEEEKMLTKMGEDKSRFCFSPLIDKQYDPDIDSRLDDPRPLPKNPVAVHYPILYDTIWDHGCGWEWYPSWGSF
ncbi:hypothetical protein C8R46DRAFT_1197157 [Mycena filopes]|nr:hypothetical protein C8R46DRAFT_1197157 [Mycena filopes]